MYDSAYTRATEAANGPEFLPAFRDWLISHWSVWQQFVKAGDRLRDRGIKEYSAFVVVNVLRYRHDIEGEKFSVTNSFVPDLARLYNKTVHPLFKVSTRKERQQ